MEFKKCPRCGSFFHTESDVCQGCKTNENLDVQKLKNYFAENRNDYNATVQDISIQTGIQAKNVNRYLSTEEFSGMINQEGDEQ